MHTDSKHRKALNSPTLGQQFNEYPSFLDAWKAGVALAGPHFFNSTREEVLAATDKNQLRPKADLEKLAEPLSLAEKCFLAAMLSYFNSIRGQKYLEDLDCANICDLAAKLDTERAHIVASLLITYRGL